MGSGTGYLTALFAEFVVEKKKQDEKSPESGGSGLVVGIDHIPELVAASRENFERDGRAELLDAGNVLLVAGDGRKGYEEGAPYDAIHVGAAAPAIPAALIAQLAPGGRMVLPVGDRANQQLKAVDKDAEGKVTEQVLMGVIYVPLTDASRQRSL